MRKIEGLTDNCEANKFNCRLYIYLVQLNSIVLVLVVSAYLLLWFWVDYHQKRRENVKTSRKVFIHYNIAER